MHTKAPWKKISGVDPIDCQSDPCDIFITHENYTNRDNKLKVIYIRYQDSSIDTIKKLVIGKSLNGIIEWYKKNNKYVSIEELVKCVIDNIACWRTVFANHQYNLDFEDIWTNPEKLLSDLSDIIGLPVNNSSKKLLSEYRRINSMLYNIDLSEWLDNC